MWLDNVLILNIRPRSGSSWAPGTSLPWSCPSRTSPTPSMEKRWVKSRTSSWHPTGHGWSCRRLLINVPYPKRWRSPWRRFWWARRSRTRAPSPTRSASSSTRTFPRRTSGREDKKEEEEEESNTTYARRQMTFILLPRNTVELLHYKLKVCLIRD